MTNVYKHKNFISGNERVKIPDFEYKQQQDDSELFGEVLDTSGETDNTKIDTLDAEEQNTFQEFSKDSEWSEEIETEGSDIEGDNETIPQPKIPSKEELQVIYERNLKELATSVAQQAYFDALNKKKAELRDCISGVQTLMDELVVTHGKFIEEFTSELKYMATDIAEKIILEKISEDDLILRRLVLQTVNNVKNAEWLNVEISERLVGLVDVIKKELDKPEYNGRSFVFPVSGTDSVCRVVTNEGAIVSSVEDQINNLREEFRNFEKQN